MAWQPKWIADPPGATLVETLEELDMTQADLARKWNVSQSYICQLCKGQKPITVPTAVKLERVTGVSAIVWLRLEAQYRLDLYLAKPRKRRAP